jgi:hypothetical protein
LLIVDQPPYDTLPAAVAAADLIVSGRVTNDKFTVDGTFVTFTIDRTVKGKAPSTDISIFMSGGPQPDANIASGVLAVDEEAPVLLVGDQALLFLQHSTVNDSYGVQPTSGWYKVASGLEALDDNPFGKSLDGLTVDQAIAIIATAE